MTATVHLQPQGAHQYVVHLTDGEEVRESWFHLSPSLLVELQVTEEACVRHTTEFLLQHQGVADFPEIVELEDVLATYDDFPGFVRARAS